MEAIILSKKNCRRVATAKRANDPNGPVMEFKFRKYEISRNFLGSQRAHIVGENTIVQDNDKEMSEWEVVSWKYETNFEDLWDLAVYSFVNNYSYRSLFVSSLYGKLERMANNGKPILYNEPLNTLRNSMKNFQSRYLQLVTSSGVCRK